MSKGKSTDDQIDMLGPTVAFKSGFLVIDGTPRTALFLSQLNYWQKEANAPGSNFGTPDDHGRMWFWKTQGDFARVTGLSKYMQRQARESLQEMPWYSEELRGMPAKTFYHIDRKHLKIWAAAKDPDMPVDDDDVAGFGGGSGPDSKNSDTVSENLDTCPEKFGDKAPENSDSDAPSHNAPASRSQTTTQTTTQSGHDERTPDREENPPPPENDGIPIDDVTDLRELADSVGLDVTSRTPIDERDGDTRLGVQQIQVMARDKLGAYWNPMSGGPWLDRLKAVSHFFSREEIEDAFDATRRKADSPGWSYFLGCLNNTDSVHASEYSSKRERMLAETDYIGKEGGVQ